MKKVLMALSILAMGGWVHAVTNGPVAISSGSSFYNVDTSSIAATATVRQNIVIGDPTLSAGLAPVSSITGLTVNLATSTAVAGEVIIQQPSVIGATVTFNGTQNVQLQTGANAIGSVTNTTFQATQPNAYNVVSTNTYATIIQPSVLGATVTFNGTQNVQLQTGANAIGSITNTSFAISTGGVTAAQSNAFNVVSTATVISSGIVTSLDSVLVSSNTALPSSTADTANVRTMGDNKGRLVTQPLVPYGNVLVATATLTTSTAETIFISSGGANTAVNLIGCIGENTSATAADITFRPGLTINAGSFKLGMSVSNVPVGFFPPGGIIQPKANLNSNWTISGSASVTSLHITCWYYNYAP